jgi:phytoene dehydrogenase-like protein
MRRFPQGWGTFKMDWALSAPVPWAVPEARQSAVVHTGDSVADLQRFTDQVRRGELPDNPYLVSASRASPTRRARPPASTRCGPTRACRRG